MPPAQVAAVRWWQALDPPIYLISVLPGAAVWLVTGRTGQAPSYLAAATLAVILLQHAINVLNDVSDWRLGADVEKHHSWARFHHLNLRTAAVHGYASLLGGALLGLAVLVAADQLRILALAAPLVVLGVLYNSGPRPLSYTHLGEWVTGLCYGPGVFGCLWVLATGRLSVAVIPGSLAFFALAVALLLSHQPPQIDTDRQAGKRSFAVRFGVARTRLAARLLYLIFLLAFGMAAWQADVAGAALGTGGLIALASALAVLRAPPSPRWILTGATLVILATLLLDRVARSIPAG
ncbi:MAG: prenyltransferase [Gammaproteobacteria bacterium]|jgi:1,4-dihydroxy-2-naphthoate octaprenyltransferase